MEVYFDFELDDNLEQPPDPDNLVHKGLKDFIQIRYKVLDEKIMATSTEDKPSFAVLIMNKEGLYIKYYNIDEPLLSQVKDCITEDDYNYITEVIWQKIQDEKRKN